MAGNIIYYAAKFVKTGIDRIDEICNLAITMQEDAAVDENS